MNNFKFTLKAWPVIALATIGLCYLTQTVAGWLGIVLPDQKNIDIVRRYAGLNWTFAFLCAQVLVLLPAFEEVIFRYLLCRLPAKFAPAKWFPAFAIASSVLFSAAHYIAQPFPDSAFIALFFFGVAQCWLYRRTQSLLCAFLNHGLFNLTNLILMFVLPES